VFINVSIIETIRNIYKGACIIFSMTEIEEYRIVNKNGKKYKVKYWDNLSYEQLKIVRDYKTILGIIYIKKNREKYLRELIKSNLQDYVIGIKLN
jgi:hypothetical protein